jgi:hypothetical protein
MLEEVEGWEKGNFSSLFLLGVIFIPGGSYDCYKLILYRIPVFFLLFSKRKEKKQDLPKIKLFVVLKMTKSLKKFNLFTDKKENQIFLIYKEIQNGAVAKSYMTNGLLMRRPYFATAPL